jgi:hypothetical protein
MLPLIPRTVRSTTYDFKMVKRRRELTSFNDLDSLANLDVDIDHSITIFADLNSPPHQVTW